MQWLQFDAKTCYLLYIYTFLLFLLVFRRHLLISTISNYALHNLVQEPIPSDSDGISFQCNLISFCIFHAIFHDTISCWCGTQAYDCNLSLISGTRKLFAFICANPYTKGTCVNSHKPTDFFSYCNEIFHNSNRHNGDTTTFYYV